MERQYTKVMLRAFNGECGVRMSPTGAQVLDCEGSLTMPLGEALQS